MDGKRTWQELMNRVGDKSKQHYFRLDVGLDEAPAIDDVTCMNRLRNSVHFETNAASARIELVSALLTASFFFELDTIPKFEGGLYRCDGSIYCRNHIYGVLRGLANANGANTEFANDDGYLANLDGMTSVCMHCHRYRKSVAFYVRDLGALTTIYLKSDESPRRRISGFPQTIQWFIKQQRLDAVFGAPDRISRAKCRFCDHGQPKRKVTGPLLESRSKKRRL